MKLTYTELAEACLKGRGLTHESIDVRVVKDVSEAIPEEARADFFFHIVTLHDLDLDLFCRPAEDGTIIVDLTNWVEGDKLDRGPFKGKTYLMPSPASDE